MVAMIVKNPLAESSMKFILRIILICGAASLLAGCGNIQTNALQILVNIQSQLGAIQDFLNALCFVLGVVFIGVAIFKLKQYGQMTVMMSTHASLGPSLAYLIVGAGLLYMPTLLDTMTVSLWGYGYDEIPGYTDQGGNYADIMVPIVALIQVIGFIAFIRGWIMLARLGGGHSQPGTLGKGLIHMLGGLLAINVVGTIEMLRETIGL